MDTDHRPILAEERRAILLQELKENGYLQAAELAEKLNTTAITIRRDLSLLETEGLCIRKRGGAVRSSQSVTLELPYQVKQNSCIPEKKRIAEAAVRLVKPGSTILLDAGSTTYALALLLSQKRITVVTNDLQIAVKLAGNANINLICTGGNRPAECVFAARHAGGSVYSQPAGGYYLSRGGCHSPGWHGLERQPGRGFAQAGDDGGCRAGDPAGRFLQIHKDRFRQSVQLKRRGHVDHRQRNFAREARISHLFKNQRTYCLTSCLFG